MDLTIFDVRGAPVYTHNDVQKIKHYKEFICLIHFDHRITVYPSAFFDLFSRKLFDGPVKTVRKFKRC